LEKLSEFSKFFKEQFSIIKKYHTEIKSAAYYLDDDPITEKVRSMNQRIFKLENR